MAPVKCCIKGCEKNIQPQHRFPNPKKDFGRFKQWIDAINNDTLTSMDPINVYNVKKVCHCHFEGQYFSVGSKRLHLNAMPSLHLPSRTTLSKYF